MRCGLVHRLFVVALSVALAAGLVGHSALALNTSASAAASAGADADMPMPGDGCAGSEKAMTLAACAAFCSGVVVPAAIVALCDPSRAATRTFAPERGPTGRTIPPDPYPPRSASLS